MPGIRKFLRTAQRRLQAFINRLQLKHRIATARPLKVVAGSGGVFEPGWIPTDIKMLDLTSRPKWQEWFKPNSIDVLLAEHVWEHLTPSQSALAAANCYTFLRSGGYLRVAVPDGFHPDPSYIEHVRPGGSGIGADDHKVLYNIRTFSRVFEEAGFQVTMLEYFDEQGVFSASDWNPEGGLIHRSQRFDRRNKDGSLAYTSIIIDAHKI